MGSVYLARQRSTGREFAVKLILPETGLGPKALAFFLREVSVLSRLDHPRIVRFHEIGEVQGQFYFAMEYVPTIDLRAIMAALSGPEQTVLACSVIADALEGLEYAHDRGIIHRDFKPSNLLVTWDGERPAVKIADFGLAKSFRSAGFSGMTPKARVMGTLAYMAPEQAQDARFVLPAADLYSAGATLYYLLAGVPPYQFGSSRNPLAVIAREDPVPLAEHCADVPAALSAIVHRALARRPEDRFPTAGAMRLALLPFAEGRLPQEHPRDADPENHTRSVPQRG
jgi:serine/threonine-protein kinase